MELQTTFPTIGHDTIIYHPHLSNIHGSVTIGDFCRIHSHVWIGQGVVIGNSVKIQAFSFIPTGITIEDHVFIGPRVTFTNDKHPPSGGKWSDTLVKRGASIGAGAVILPGLTIGQNTCIGAGTVVTHDVPDGETWIGNPGKSINKHI